MTSSQSSSSSGRQSKSVVKRERHNREKLLKNAPSAPLEKEKNVSASCSMVSSILSSLVPKQKNEEEIYMNAMKTERFAEMEMAHHSFEKIATQDSHTARWTKCVGAEYKGIAENLPLTRDSSIFIRVHDSKMQFARFAITGPVGSPYSRGVYIFDIFFGSSYPNSPPQVLLITTGGGTVRFNPNLYADGKVCLSLLGTWSGGGTEKWQSGKSTFLQVVVSIQSLVMGVAQPFFNEPGYVGQEKNPEYKGQSEAYNRSVQVNSVRWAMIEPLKQPQPGFEKVVRAHFFLQRDAILKEVEQWSATNPDLKPLLPELRLQLNKLSAKDCDTASAA